VSNLLESIRDRVKALSPHIDMSVLKKSVDEQFNFLWAHRELFIQAWVAETGIHPSQCILVERRSYDGSFGTMSVSIVAKSQEQIDAEIEATKLDPVIVAEIDSIERYDLDCESGPMSASVSMVEDLQGEWVRWEDVKPLLDALSKIPPKIDRAENNIDSVDKGE
jgi:hypothetical protein